MNPHFTPESTTPKRLNSGFSIYCPDEGATLAFATQFAEILQQGLVIYLQGDLGAGKTTFARGLIHSLGHLGKVKSPTYTLVEPYTLVDKKSQNQFMLYHFDLYRFIDEDEWDAAGFRDYFNTTTICLIEWPDKAGHLCPNADISINILHETQGRTIVLKANTPTGAICLEQLSALSA